MSVFASNRKDDFPSHWPSGMAVEFEPPQRPVRAGPPSGVSTFLAVVCNYFNTIRHQTHKHTLTHTRYVPKTLFPHYFKLPGEPQKPFAPLSRAAFGAPTFLIRCSARLQENALCAQNNESTCQRILIFPNDWAVPGREVAR